MKISEKNSSWMICKLHWQVASQVLFSDKMLIHFVLYIWWNFCFGPRVCTDQCQNLILGVGWNRWIHHTATRTARRPPPPPARVPRHRREVRPRLPWSNMERLSFSDTTGLCRRVSILEILYCNLIDVAAWTGLARKVYAFIPLCTYFKHWYRYKDRDSVSWRNMSQFLSVSKVR